MTWLRGLAPVLLLLCTACGGPTTPPVSGPFIFCPADFNVDSPDGEPATITYSLPGVSGGVAPHSVTCTPPSGAAIPVGAQQVSCTVADARGATAACSFTARVIGPPRLRATRFLAFGDSLTYGRDSPPVPTLVDVPGSYPSQLDDLLSARFRLQTITVMNDGVPGELAQDGGVVRLPRSLDEHRPEVLLLMEGTNDIFGGNELGAARALAALEQMIREATARGVRVFLATIPPQRPGGGRNAAALFIPGFNDRIRALAQREGVVVVDVFDALKDRLYLIGIDDLHPTIAGYSVIAQTFHDVLTRELEEPR